MRKLGDPGGEPLVAKEFVVDVGKVAGPALAADARHQAPPAGKEEVPVVAALVSDRRICSCRGRSIRVNCEVHPPWHVDTRPISSDRPGLGFWCLRLGSSSCDGKENLYIELLSDVLGRRRR